MADLRSSIQTGSLPLEPSNIHNYSGTASANSKCLIMLVQPNCGLVSILALQEKQRFHTASPVTRQHLMSGVQPFGRTSARCHGPGQVLLPHQVLDFQSFAHPGGARPMPYESSSGCYHTPQCPICRALPKGVPKCLVPVKIYCLVCCLRPHGIGPSHMVYIRKPPGSTVLPRTFCCPFFLVKYVSTQLVTSAHFLYFLMMSPTCAKGSSRFNIFLARVEVGVGVVALTSTSTLCSSFESHQYATPAAHYQSESVWRC